MLVPAVDDPNRKQELQRMKDDPKSFDADAVDKHRTIAGFDTSTSGLVVDRDNNKDKTTKPRKGE